jgi:hypothetical protein
MTDRGRRFTVSWKSRNRDKHSAVMTQPEAETFAQRLRVDNVDEVSIREDTAAPFAALRARYALQMATSKPAQAVAGKAARFPTLT